ncbi:DeoR/GlpR transcriptional regulator [Agrobacterium rhizogenes]|uniref:DeoR/GlpR family DNA-binding transcription regulator n=1 Tax=Rhizobium TaxID=379 RepID=UPI00026ECA0A|nr:MULTISPECIES: DeoR/GlpR family DNA-binding transcription regulator [Rhizobium]OCJ26368.1 DeoR family transcriptional regulator [Agrobacterium sp. B131/95]OCJ32028.1 DeoR family transcriptional regulator [Agrobacterium sp. B133/95]EJK80430.1 transcriptional regulator of sugar metabolism [Rhizobium sp. AP16]MDJ1633034.1 DeoR/GlpR family DNA-binding transcription regulator [Rhizobium rhizogenes]NTG06516.1 DeoR/GlpR transcriptional regulator [Rhizobium rhizogenes]
MLTSQRKTLILDILRRDGQVIAKSVADDLGLSEDTIRRDLREMAAEKLLKRVHGGALPLSPELPDFSARQNVSSEVKRQLGAYAAGMVRPGQTVFLDGGTTNAEIARHLPRDFAFTIVTHSPTIAGELEHHPTAEVILIGGKLYKHSMVATGAVAMAAISLVRPDIFFLGVTAIHPARGLSTGDFEEAAIKRHITQCSAETYVLATQEKLDAASPCHILPITAISGMIVPSNVAEGSLAPYRDAGVSILVA